MIGLLMIREFTIQAQLAQLRRKTVTLAQDVALHRTPAMGSNPSEGDK